MPVTEFRRAQSLLNCIVDALARGILVTLTLASLLACSRTGIGNEGMALERIELPTGLHGTLAYTRHQKHRNWGIVLVDLESGRRRLIPASTIKDYSWVGGLDFSPDGKTLVGHVRKKRSDIGQIIFIDTETGKTSFPSLFPQEALNPRYSPGGQQLAFYTAQENGNFRIVIADLKEKQLLTLPCPGARCLHPNWGHSDGQALFFVAYDNQKDTASHRVVRYPVDAHKKTDWKKPLYTNKSELYVNDPKSIPGSSELAITLSDYRINHKAKLLALDPETGAARVLFEEDHSLGSSAFLGTRKYVAYGRYNSLSLRVEAVIRDLDTSKIYKISNPGFFGTGPIWTPHKLLK